MSDNNFIPSGKVLGDDSQNTPVSVAGAVPSVEPVPVAEPATSTEESVIEESVNPAEITRAEEVKINQEVQDEPKAVRRDKFCRNCGELLGETAKFCRNCGTPIVVVEAEDFSQETATFCQEATTETPKSSDFTTKTVATETTKVRTDAEAGAAAWSQQSQQTQETWSQQTQSSQEIWNQQQSQQSQQAWQQDSKNVKGSSKKSIAIFFGIIIVIIVLAIIGIMSAAASVRPSSGNPMTKAVYYEGGEFTIEDNLYIKAGTKTMVHFVPYKGDASTCTWYVDDATIALIDSKGVLFTKSEGTVTVLCIFPNGVQQSMTVYIAD